MILSELIPFLKTLEARPKKKLSQNFLIDANIVEKIIKTASIQPGDTVLEIGPGPGFLTQELLKKGASVYAVELDATLAQELSRLQNGRLQIFASDFLKFPLDILPSPIKVVANLPYHITTPILEKLFEHPFSSITIMVQKEVADRMAAKAGSKTFGSLSLFIQFYSEVTSLFSVPPTCFFPQPKVHSTVIRLDAKTPPSIPPSSFFSIVHKAFQQRRKMLTSSLLFPKELIQEALSSIGARTDARPEVLSFDQWVAFAKLLLEKKPTYSSSERRKESSLDLFGCQ